jgi:hypothetical protein
MGITAGKQPTYKLDKIPSVVTVDPWDGKDGVPIEEEPLEDIMGWDDDDDDDDNGQNDESQGEL